MTNFEYIKVSDKNELAELIAALLINTVEPLCTALGEELTDTQIKLEALAIKQWLDTEMISGDYLN